MAHAQEFAQILASVRRGEAAQRTLTAEGKTWIRRFQPQERLILLGCGYISQALCRQGAELGFSVTAVDDRPSFANHTLFPQADSVVCDSFTHAIPGLSVTERDYVAILTRGHRYDADCLRTLLPGTFPFYLGMVGSRRRVVALKEQLVREGFDRALLEKVHTPIGLDINALTVPEIAVSIAAELVACRRAGLDRRSRSSVLTDDGVALPVLEFLAEETAPRAVITICETAGSTPVKSGAVMAMDHLGRVAGTVGGGCGEAGLMADARKVIRDGGKRLVTVELNNDIAAEEGMVCGGAMTALIEAVED